MLYPMCKSESLSDEQRESACIWAEQKASGCLSVLIPYESEASPFPSSYFLPPVKNMDHVTCWKAIRANANFSSLVQLLNW